ncbi:unnamed protein product, partial [Urochloa humidicola]
HPSRSSLYHSRLLWIDHGGQDPVAPPPPTPVTPPPPAPVAPPPPNLARLRHPTSAFPASSVAAARGEGGHALVDLRLQAGAERRMSHPGCLLPG